MKLCKRKNLMLLTTVLCGVGLLSMPVKALEYTSYEAFLTDSDNPQRTYNFSGDETLNIYISSSGLGQDSQLTINGNGYTLLSGDDDWLHGLSLNEGQTAQINNLQIKDFDQGINNNGLISSISGLFTGNHNASQGAGIANGGYIKTIKADFKNNYVNNTDGNAWGSAILNGYLDSESSAVILSIQGNFEDNYSQSGTDYAAGGAIVNAPSSQIGSISNSTFKRNSARSTDSFGGGGALGNAGIIGDVTADFIENYVKTKDYAAGGALGNGLLYPAEMGNVQGLFDGNRAISTSSYALGGALINTAKIGEIINSTFQNNYAQGALFAAGGAIYSSADLTIKANGEKSLFQNNTANGSKNDIYMDGQTFGETNPLLTLTALEEGSIDINSGIAGNLYRIKVSGDETGVININESVIGNPDFEISSGSVHFNLVNDAKNTMQLNTLTINSASVLNIDVMLNGTGESDYFDVQSVSGAENLSLDSFHIVSDMDDDINSLIIKYASTDLTKADLEKKSISTTNWIYTYINTGSSLEFQKYKQSGGYVAYLLDDIRRGESYNFTEDETINHDGLVIGGSSKLIINGQGHALSAETKEGTSALKLTGGQSASISGLTISGFDTALETAGELDLNSITITDSTTGLKLDADVLLSGTNTFEGNETDIVSTGTYMLNLTQNAVLNLNSKLAGSITFGGSKDALISLSGSVTTEDADLVLNNPTLKLANEATNLKDLNSFEARSGTIDSQNDAVRALVANNFSITGAINVLVDADLANKTMDTLGDVRVDGGSINVSGIKILSDGLEDLTQINFAEDSYKDKVSTSVKQVLSTQYTYKVAYNEETGQFEFVREKELAPEEVIINQTPAVANAGAMMLTEAVSQKVLNTDSIKSQGASSGDAFGLKAWVQTFGSRDDVELKHLSPTIDAKFYGVLGGIDSKTFAYDNGIKATYGVYGAYTRSEQKYSGNKIKQKGGYFGLKALFEKGGLFSKVTANMGFLNNEALTEWGKDKFDTKVISAATQTGYDLKKKIKNFDLTITPSLYVGYMGIDTDDYTSKAGTAIKNKFMNVVEITPELKVANNFGNGLEGYLKGAYKMFIYDNDQVRVDTALLPSMSVKPYVEYGFGFEKTFSSAKAYGDIMRHDGGKRGWDFNLGIKLEF